MNILILTPDYPPVYGGIGTHVYSLAKRLVKNGQEVTVVVTRIAITNSGKKGILRYNDYGVNVVDIPDNWMNENQNIQLDEFY